MVIFALMIAVQAQEKQVYIVHENYELSDINFLKRNKIKEVFRFVVRQSLPCLQKNTRNSVINEDQICHIQMSSKNVAAYAFVSQGYPQRVVFAFLSKVLALFYQQVGSKHKQFRQDQNLTIQGISAQFKRYQNPKSADKLTQAIAEVEQTKVVIHESIKKLLERQGNLDDLVKKSKDLSQAAKTFHNTSNQVNKPCCQII